MKEAASLAVARERSYETADSSKRLARNAFPLYNNTRL